jgi:Na+/citrate or Na+/malate symporter
MAVFILKAWRMLPRQRKMVTNTQSQVYSNALLGKLLKGIGFLLSPTEVLMLFKTTSQVLRDYFRLSNA